MPYVKGLGFVDKGRVLKTSSIYNHIIQAAKKQFSCHFVNCVYKLPDEDRYSVQCFNVRDGEKFRMGTFILEFKL